MSMVDDNVLRSAVEDPEASACFDRAASDIVRRILADPDERERVERARAETTRTRISRSGLDFLTQDREAG